MTKHWKSSSFFACLALLASAPGVFGASGAKEFAEVVEAIRNADESRLTSLLKNQKVVELRDELGSTPLIHASLLGNARSLELLLKAGANPNATNHAGVTP